MKLRAETVYVEVVQQEVSLLLMKTTGEDLSNACNDGKRAVVEAPN
jgi:hypothetical protein